MYLEQYAWLIGGLPRYYPHWTVHRRLREVEALRSDVINLTGIQPHFALVSTLEDDPAISKVSTAHSSAARKVLSKSAAFRLP